MSLMFVKLFGFTVITVTRVGCGEVCSISVGSETYTAYCDVGGCCTSSSDRIKYTSTSDLCCLNAITVSFIIILVGLPIITAIIVLIVCCYKRYKNRKTADDSRIFHRSNLNSRLKERGKPRLSRSFPSSSASQNTLSFVRRVQGQRRCSKPSLASIDSELSESHIEGSEFRTFGECSNGISNSILFDSHADIKIPHHKKSEHVHFEMDSSLPNTPVQTINLAPLPSNSELVPSPSNSVLELVGAELNAFPVMLPGAAVRSQSNLSDDSILRCRPVDSPIRSDYSCSEHSSKNSSPFGTPRASFSLPGRTSED